MVAGHWEQAYYLKYQNKRSDYTNAFLNVINYNNIEERFNDLCKVLCNMDNHLSRLIIYLPRWGLNTLPRLKYLI
ncbi:MAG: hypothetical protein IIB40_11335 [Candidatus Marinimicrobia bacterium]|nr:hypothetical protein [Candidatus Neomarinimicrobiota bacterium]